MSENLRILGLQVENFMALKAVTIQPDPKSPVIEVTGKNGNGKSSILTAIQSALGGKRMLVDDQGEPITDPIRHGARQARIFLDIGHLTRELTVEVVITADDWKLVVRDAKGKAQSSPQGILNKLYSSVAFDPESFMRQKPKEQVETLSRLVGIDWTELNAKRQKLFDERTLKGRELESAKAQLSAMPFNSDAPAEESAPQDLVDELTKAQLHNRDGATIKARMEARKNDANVRAREREQIKADIARLEQELLAKRAALAKTQDMEAEIGRDLIVLQTQLADFVPQDEDSIKSALFDVQTNNRKVQQNKAHEIQNARVQECQFAYDKLTSELQAIDQQKADELEWAKFPMDGLTFKDDLVLFKGVPLNQRSQAEKSRIAVAISAALNPKLPVVLIRNGSLYDEDSKAALYDEAAKRGLHVFMEIVNSSSPSAVVIEAGEVRK